jgi:PAS domain S-box-containing protein
MSQGEQAMLGIQEITPFLNASWAKFWQGADQQAATEAIARARAGEVCTFQGYRLTIAGEPKWWDSKVSPVRGADGLERLLCISQDITQRKRSEDDRKQAEERLRESEERLSAIFSQATVGLSEASLDGHFQRVNDKICRILGRLRQEMLAATVLDVTYPEDMPKSLEALEQMLETGEPVSLDKRYLRPDGTIVWANSSLTRLDDEQGRPRAILAVTVDLSDRKQAEENLRESEERYRAIVNQAVTGVAYSDIGGKLTLVNQKYCDITGYSAAELSQMRMYEITHPEDLPRNVELYNRMVTESTPFEIEKRYITNDGSIVWVNNYVSAITDREGKPQSIIAIVLDITDRKQAEAEREQLLAKERHYANQLQGLTSAALAINSAVSVEEVLQVITDQAASIIGAHQSVTSMTVDQNWTQAINAVYLSDKYAQWRDYAELPDGSGIYGCVYHPHRAIQVTQAELEAHPGQKDIDLSDLISDLLKKWIGSSE